MIKALDRRLLRDLAQLRTQAIAIALVVASPQPSSRRRCWGGGGAIACSSPTC